MTKLSKDRVYALKNEIKMAQALNREELEPILSESIERYTGEHVPHIGVNWDIHLNEVYPVIQANLPAIFFRNPRAFLKPRNKTFIAKKREPISGKMVEVELDSAKSAKTQENILNYAIGEINYKQEARRCLMDALLFPYAVMWHGYKGSFGMTEERSLVIKKDRVFVKRTNPLRFIHDPAVSISNLDEGNWVGRIIDIPYTDFIEDDIFDIDKSLIKGFKGFGDKIGTASYNQQRQSGGNDFIKLSAYRSLLDTTDKEYQNSKAAMFVRIFELFLRPTKKEAREGKKGTIIVLTDEQQKPLRENEWSIKAEGWPSHILQFNELNDAMFGLADVETYASIADQKNVIVNLQIRNAQETGKTWVGISKEGTTEEDVEKIQQGQNTIVMFESGNPRDRMFVASAGGQASSELYTLDQRIQRNLEDKSGVTDLKRGYLQSGEESAASVKIRNAGGSARPAYRQDIMSEFIKNSFHYVNQLLKQFTPYEDAVRIVGSLDIEWSENISKEELQANTDVELDVISMLPENPEKELQELNTVLMLMIQGLTDPVVAQKLQQEGKTMNISPLIEQILLRMKIRNPEVFRNIKPEESQGFVSVQQIRQAKENVTAALTGQQPPYPPDETQDHKAHLEIYTSIKQLLEMAGQTSDMLEQLIQIQGALLTAQEEEQANPGQKVNLKQPSLQTVGA